MQLLGPDLRNRMVKRVKLRQRVKFCGDRFNRRRDMAFFDFSRWLLRHLGFLKFETLTVGQLKGPNCVAMLSLVEIGQTASDIWRFFIFQDGGDRHLGSRRHLRFLKFEFFNGRTAQGAELRRRARFKFGRNRSNRGRDMAIFPFLQRAQCSHCKRGISYSNSVRPSVRLSVRYTPVLCQNYGT